MQFLIWLETTGISVWIRETPSLWGFPFILFLHTLGLALLAGINAAFMLWILRFSAEYPLAPMAKYFPVMWLGLFANAVSGVLLLIAYPAKALTNPVFYAKLIAITIAIVLTLEIHKRVFVAADASRPLAPGRFVRRAAACTIGLWLIAIGTGRFLAYTHSILMASDPNFY
jgi:hypothetical protein